MAHVAMYQAQTARLSGSDMGRVEVEVGGAWGTVCHDFWDKDDATVICRQLGLPDGDAQATGGASFGGDVSNWPIGLDDVRCEGTENHISDCSHAPLGVHNCDHSKDAGVVCTNAFSVQIRLLGGGYNEHKGRVEVMFNNVWGSVCNNAWDNNDAMVVCRQLGHPHGEAQAIGSTIFGESSGPIWMDDVECLGSESSLVNCSHTAWGYHTLSVQIELVGGNNANEGRVEVRFNHIWGTICNNAWDNNDANVVCRQLGLPYGGAEATGVAIFGQGSGPIWLDDVECLGSESSLANCSHAAWGYHSDCTHAMDAGVICKSVSIRLVGGNISSVGRVEYFYNNTWGTVCHHNWGRDDAYVVCRQLQLPFLDAQETGNALFGEGAGQIWLNNVDCVGSENALDECIHHGWGISTGCTHEMDAGVICTDEFSTDVRLVGGGSAANKGRIEVFFRDVWGGVCPDLWDNDDAAVVCRHLGLPYGAAKAAAIFGRGSGHKWLSKVQCLGSESRLEDCDHSGWGYYTSCSWNLDDAGVICSDADFTVHTRITGGNSPYVGRVEVKIGQSYGTICHDLWDEKDAKVVCRHIGLPSSDAKPTGGAIFGKGTGPILLDDVQCVGSEPMVASCSHRGFGFHFYCEHTNDAGVICTDDFTFEVRLTGGDPPDMGRIEVKIGNSWGTICHDAWDQNDATVVCRQRGLPFSDAQATGGASFGDGSDYIWLNVVECVGSENKLEECSHAVLGYHNCDHSKDAGVICTDDFSVQVRLTGGNSSNAGRVEVFIGNTWGTICHDAWDQNDATVVCRQLGLSFSDAQATGGASFGEGSGTIWLDDVNCSGTETKLSDCIHAGLGFNQISDDHSEDAGVICTDDFSFQVRLTGGNSSNAGRVEVFIGNSWGTICHDAWDQNDATVVCRQLGLPFSDAQATGGASFGEGSGTIWLDDVDCDGTEKYFSDCIPAGLGFNQISDNHSEDAGVICTDDFSFQVRLTGGNSSNAGRVEVFIGNSWGTICDDGWDQNDAMVVCRQLGLPFTDAQANGGASFGEGSGTIWLDDVNCGGTENKLSDCIHAGLGFNQISDDHSKDAGVICIDVFKFQVKLTGDIPGMGRVEVKIANSWGTICHDAWDKNDATVVCRQRGLPFNDAQATGGASFGDGSGLIWLDDVRCVGTETKLEECSHAALGYSNCDHSKDAGVICTDDFSFQVRLTGGNSSNAGRVEVFIGNSWGTICDNGWDDNDATVVCRQLGLPFSDAQATGGASFGEGSGTIWLNNVDCDGTETKLSDCIHAGLGFIQISDDHNEDAGVICTDGMYQMFTGKMHAILYTGRAI
ncbi:scavenger receptor cysteine-rich domain-containing protein DMBT1-like [Amphiura filiformis]|uniref:scavenger receptor cysteine-rich domain-containing protein DMBT1-like n=1 Tax=Amphiura filiformis TaxID=82378 RepID=UPI003B22872E